MKAILATTPWNNKTPEDLWWCRNVVNLPSEVVAERWGVVSRWYNGIPTGAHRFWRFTSAWNYSGDYLRTFAKNNNIGLN